MFERSVHDPWKEGSIEYGTPYKSSPGKPGWKLLNCRCERIRLQIRDASETGRTYRELSYESCDLGSEFLYTYLKGTLNHGNERIITG
jgi:hypothetical protein